MDVHIIVKPKSSYEAWHKLFVPHTYTRSKMCDVSRTLVGKANQTAAFVTIFDVDIEAMGGMTADPEFQKLTEDHVEEDIPYSMALLEPVS
jgi:hypothetical protein